MPYRKYHGLTLAGALVAVALTLCGVQAAPAPGARTKAAPAHAKITAAQARSIALKRFPGKVVGKTSLEDEEGTWQYGVMVQSGKVLREVMINAKTGKVDSVEVTNASTERKEAKAELAKAKHAARAKKGRPAKAAGHAGKRR